MNPLLWRVGIEGPHVSALLLLAGAVVVVWIRTERNPRTLALVGLAAGGLHESIFTALWVAATPGDWLGVLTTNAGAFDAKVLLYVGGAAVGLWALRRFAEPDYFAWAVFFILCVTWATYGLPTSSPSPLGFGNVPAEPLVAALWEFGYNVLFALAFVFSFKKRGE